MYLVRRESKRTLYVRKKIYLYINNFFTSEKNG